MPWSRNQGGIDAMERTGTIVLNGWAASEHAWDLCAFMNRTGPDGGSPVLYSYVDQLDGLPERAFGRGGRYVVVGWSMGGSSALRLACRYPLQIAGLVLIAATPRMMEERDSGWKGMSPSRLEALRRGFELTHGQGFFGLPPDKPNPYIEDSPENLARGLLFLKETDVRGELSRVFADGCGFPVYVLQSEHDGIVQSSNADYLKRIFPAAVVHRISGGEHALPIWTPELIDDAVKYGIIRANETDCRHTHLQ